jgi:uncharacterized protein
MAASAPGKTRVVWLDVLRGLALFGIAQINFPSFAAGNLPTLVLFDGAPDAASRSLFALVEFAIAAKFYPLFAFLFGYGHVIQRRNLNALGILPETILYRRYAALLVLGAIHGTLLFFGDILTLYAICGMILTFSFRARLPFSQLTLMFAVISVLELTLAYAQDGATPVLATLIASHHDELGQLAQGRLADVMVLRANAYVASLLTQLAVFLPQLLMLMCAGALAAERQLFEHALAHRRIFGLMLAIGILAGVPISVALAAIMYTLAQGEHAGVLWNLSDLCADAAFVLTLAVIGALGRCAARAPQPLPRPLIWLASTGQMALTNYLVQSLLMVFIWYSSAPWLSRHHPFALLWTMSLAVCALQVVWSHHRVKSGKQGPFEALWRRYTYAPLRAR